MRNLIVSNPAAPSSVVASTGTRAEPLSIVIHDYSGHPFQVQLSRQLAHLGHRVRHWYCESYPGGKGSLTVARNDPPGFTVEGLSMGSAFARYQPAHRLVQEMQYGLHLGRRIAEASPDVVVLCNVPLLAHWVTAESCKRAGIATVFWHQDIYSRAIGLAAEKALPRFGRSLGRVAERFERRVARISRAVIAISDVFVPVLDEWGVASKTTVIPNWATLSELPLRPRDNAWAQQHGLVGRPVVMYTGTLGLKHDPQIIIDIAEELSRRAPEARVVVVSEGMGRDWLEQERVVRRLDNLLLLDYQPYDLLPDVMASADVLLALLQPDASAYSVPSKVLSYLCAGRPIVGALPPDNAAAVTLRESGAGVVCHPDKRTAFVEQVLRLLQLGETSEQMAVAGRRYAEKHFQINTVARRFEEILLSVRDVELAS